MGKKIHTDVDVVVIGSGAGGLSAAVALANAGLSVQVFEQHYLPGGWCHSFGLGGYRFSPGVHYIGELQDGGRSRQLYEGLGLGPDLTFLELNPDGFDHVIIGQERFDIPKGRAAFEERLIRRFPHEASGIRRYFNIVNGIGQELEKLAGLSPTRRAWQLVRSPHLARWFAFTAEQMVQSCVQDPLLQGILFAQAGDHGAAPSRASAPVHSVVQYHYFNGGYYPKGGGGALPKAMIRRLRQQGGDIHTRTAVDCILTENHRAVGVRLQNGTEVRAKWIISNADPKITYGKLLRHHPAGWLLRQRLARSAYSVAACSLFMAANVDLDAAGIDSGNYWIFDTPDVASAYNKTHESWVHRTDAFPMLFLTATTKKDPFKTYGGTHVLESFALMPYDGFERWELTDQENRPGDYTQMKEGIMARMLKQLERVVPGLQDGLVFQDLGTPLTNDFYCTTPYGALYGLEKSRFQVGPFAYPVLGAVNNLFNVGASTLSHGVLGASMSGIEAARHILKCGFYDVLCASRGPVKVVSAEAAEKPRQKHSTAA